MVGVSWDDGSFGVISLGGDSWGLTFEAMIL